MGKISNIDTGILEKIGVLENVFSGAHNIRSNGVAVSRSTSKNINIDSRENNSGIIVTIEENTIGEEVHVPVILSNEDYTDTVNNIFEVGKFSDVTVVSGCGVHNHGKFKTEHDGTHEIYVREGAKLKYIEKHYAEGNSSAKKVFKTITKIYVEKDGVLEMELSQIKGVDYGEKEMEIHLSENASLKISEKMMTDGEQVSKSNVVVELNGTNSSAQVVSRSVAKDNSEQKFYFSLKGQNKSKGHIECDSIIMGNARVTSIPALEAFHVDAALIHEAAIGKIASEQLMKLMSLGLSEKEAEETILEGFLK
ncbi:SufD family Fe-S cluster assembly protein [Clostridium sediminicola]|uniref:SufB/SufD family protein n=1 Tax=Clostridium sediminicola TaxID=3114879 RepID=UPI0031F1FD0B